MDLGDPGEGCELQRSEHIEVPEFRHPWARYEIQSESTRHAFITVRAPNRSSAQPVGSAAIPANAKNDIPPLIWARLQP